MAKPEKTVEQLKMENIISLCKRRGFIFQGSEIYGGLAGTWDYGPLGVTLKNNVKDYWWKKFVTDREDMYGMDAAILMNQNVWKATGHVGGFSDPLSECKKCKKRFRTDQLPDKKKCPDCGGEMGEERQFNMLFKTNVGAIADDTSVSYLRPETAQGMFVNYKNIIDSFHPKLPFGMAQIGKAFRNEIAPRDFTFRSREFEQMEIEYLIKPETWKEIFEHFRTEMLDWIKEIGLKQENVYEHEIPDEDRAFYSKRTIDFEFQFQALVEGVTLARRELANYGGLNMRLSARDKQTILTHIADPATNPRAAWACLAGIPPDGKQPVSVAILQPATNPEYPGDWVQYPDLNWLQPTFPSQGTRYELTPGKTLVLRYRLVVFYGEADAALLQRLWTDYAGVTAPTPATSEAK